MRISISLPARINILGNPADANEGDFATLSAAVDLRAGAFIEHFSPGLLLESVDSRDEYKQGERLYYPEPEMPMPYNGQFDLVKGALNRLYAYSLEFREKFNRQGVRIGLWSQVPRQSGLGGSSLFVLLTLVGMRELFGLDRKIHNDYFLAELAQRVEALELGITCGFADRYVPLFGGLAYLDYRGKLDHLEIGKEPYVTYERLDDWVDQLPLVAVCTGIQHESGDVHGRMRPRYLDEHHTWVRQGGDPPPMVRWMSGAWKTAWQGKIALLEDDLETFGKLINENHHLVNEMMLYCGFTDGVGWANNLFIESALQQGALGAKLTGAGGGGSVFALVKPGQEEHLVEAWKRTATQAGLESAYVYIPRISRTGLQISIQ
jgi:galactokinase/mevalonate kinase-like predicted kinase